jgi:hypothetical protein
MDDYWRNKYKGVPILSLESTIAVELRVAQNINQVYLLGRRGALAQNFAVPKALLNILNPDVIVLDIGTNDLARGVTVTNLVEGMKTISSQLLNHCSCVVLLSIVPRGAGFVEPVDQTSFYVAMKRTNYILKHCNWEGVRFWKQKGFYEIQSGGKKIQKPISDWSYDGIHPNKPVGRSLYANSIRSALCQYLNL